MKLQNTFVQSRMNRDIDERLIPKGQYINAENIRVVSSDGSDVGAVENIKGNEKLTTEGIAGATVIGACIDESNNHIYYFVTSPTLDIVYEYNTLTDTLVRVLQDTAGRELDFNASNLITGCDVILGNTLEEKQLAWTDNLNPPRKIYIETAKTFGLDNFDIDDISTIKRPPSLSPVVCLGVDVTIKKNRISDKFFVFSHRYIYEGGEESSNSFFSESLFPYNENIFVTDSIVSEANFINVSFNTGDSRVKTIEVLGKEIGSNTIFILDRVDKETLSLSDNTTYTIKYDNQKTYSVLNDNDALSLYNNVPAVAKEQSFINNRLMYLNYVDGYNMEDNNGDPIELDYTTVASKSSIPSIQFGSVTGSGTKTVAIDMSSLTDLKKNTFINGKFIVTDTASAPSTLEDVVEGQYVVSADFATWQDLYDDSSAVNDWLVTLFTLFTENNTTGIVITTTSVANILTVVIDAGSNGFFSSDFPEVISINETSKTYLSGSSQEFGILYYDNYNRSSSVQVSTTNTVNFREIYTSVDKINNVAITINHLPPVWATKYKIVRKSNDYNFDIIRPNTLLKYDESAFYYFPILSSEIDKVKVGEDLEVQYVSYNTAFSGYKPWTFTVEEIVDKNEVQVGDYFTGEFYPSVDDNIDIYIKLKLVSGDVPSIISKNDVAVTDGTVSEYSSILFRTINTSSPSENFYETPETFFITNGFHLSPTQNQTGGQPAIIDLQDGDSYYLTDALEHYKLNDKFLGNKYENVEFLRPSLVSKTAIKLRRDSSITYSGLYVSDSGLNNLSTFNTTLGNFKDLNRKDGSIQKSHAKEGNLIVFQEHQVSKILAGRDVFFNGDGTVNVTSTDRILGQQINYAGEYGIGSNPESFSFWGNSMYFTDTHRGVVLRLGANGLTEISKIGMRDYFKDKMIDNPASFKFGGYDPINDEYIININDETVAFSSIVNAWTSFYSILPEHFINISGKFYSFKGGELYIHNSEGVNRNTFYDVQYPSKVSLIVNDNPSEIKELQAVSLEGNNTWEALIKAFVSNSDDFTESSIKRTEFVKKEGIWYAYARRNESDSSFDSKATYGLGVVLNVTATTFELNGGSTSLCVGDSIVKGSDLTNIGIIQSITDGVIELISTAGLVDTDYVLGMKNSRIEGGNLRGYSIRMDLTTQEDNKVELFAVNAEVMKSFS